MNLTVIAIAGLVALSCTIGAYFKGRDDGAELQKGQQHTVDDYVRQANAAMADTAASAIAGIQIKQTTIKQRVEHETSTVPVYMDCHHTPDGLRALNDALTNAVASGAASGVQLPSSAASH